MTKCEILETFKGSQDGRFTEEFLVGTIRDVSEYLLPLAPKGALRVVGDEVLTIPDILRNKRSLKDESVENKATITTGSRGKK